MKPLSLLAAPILILAIAIGIGRLLLADAWRWVGGDKDAFRCK